ncbi:MAG: hypothetical protein KGY44_04645 [Halanaerobiales bacterium]|nr:hypothetical protein [Halanaerobiales bacterium]
MNRNMIIVLIMCMFFSYGLNIYAQEPDFNNELGDSIFYSPDYNSINISQYVLNLPDQDRNFRDIESEYQIRLRELAERYGSKQDNIFNVVFTKEELTELNTNNNISYQPFSNVNIGLNYNQEEDNEIIENKTAVEANYSLDENILVRAGYEFFNIKDNNTNINQSVDENNIDSRFGISYQTTDRIKIFGDYIYNDILMAESGQSTVFGIQYNDIDSTISAEYSIGSQTGYEARTTGITYQYGDLASFSASYKLLDPEQLANQLKQQEWDFGADINLSEQSTFSVGLQIINNEAIDTKEGSSTLNPNNIEQETNVEASFKIKF